MRVSQQLQYAIYGVFDLAYNGGSRPMSIQEVATRQGLPARYLEQIFQRLRRAGLVRSRRGPGGGYLLARSPDKIRLSDVLVAVQGSLLIRSAAPEGPQSACPGFVWELLTEGLEEVFAGLSIADLCRQAARRGVTRVETEPTMYYI